MIVRMRALPSGTVGNAIPVPIMPSLNSSREKSMVKRPSPTMMGVIGLARRRVDAANIEAEVAQLFFPVAGVLPQFLHEFRLLFQHVECGDAGGGDGWRMRGREQEWTPAMVEKLDEIACAADIAAQRANRLR